MSSPEIGLIWWGGACVELRIRDTRIVIDPYLQPPGDEIDYILITHEHYDHCHEPTLRRLVAGRRFKRIVVPPSALQMSRLDSPIEENPTDLEFVDPEQLTVMYPRLKRSPDADYPEPGQLDLGDGLRIDTIDSSERPTRYIGGTYGGGEWVAGSLPTLGYLIEDEYSGVGILHPGDLHEAFDAQRQLRGRVDYMLYPSIKLRGVEHTVLDNIRPRTIVPMHYYLDRPEFPLRMHMGPDDVTAINFATGDPLPGATPEDYLREVKQLIKAHWYPTPLDPLREFVELERRLPAHTELLVVTAGDEHPLAPNGAKGGTEAGDT